LKTPKAELQGEK